MLVPMKEILQDAKARNYGVVAPNVFDSKTVSFCLEIAEEMKSPLIIDWITKPERPADLIYFAETSLPVLAHAKVPVALNLDHGDTYEYAMLAIRHGFTSVMADRSTLSFEENVRQVAEIAKVAHAVGVSVEAELGHVGQAANYADDRNAGLTDPEEACKYVEMTGVDCLAVAVGTAHGLYQGTPYLDFELLDKLNRMLDIPLVLHGGSGSGDEALARAIELGVRKINIGTEFFMSGLKATKDFLEANPKAHLFQLPDLPRDAYREGLAKYFKLFGSAGKA